jgi:hypothetical protein
MTIRVTAPLGKHVTPGQLKVTVTYPGVVHSGHVSSVDLLLPMITTVIRRVTKDPYFKSQETRRRVI